MELKHRTPLTPTRTIRLRGQDYNYWDRYCRYYFGDIRGSWIHSRVQQKLNVVFKDLYKTRLFGKWIGRILDIRVVEYKSAVNANLITEIYFRGNLKSRKEWSRFKYKF